MPVCALVSDQGEYTCARTTHVSHRCYDRRQNTHDPIPANGNAIPCSSMRTWQHFRRVCVQRAIVNIQAKVDDAGECHILRRCPDLRVCEEERHRNKRSNDHRVLSAQSGPTHPASENGTPDAAEVDESVVAPCDVWRRLAKRCATRGQVCGRKTL